MYSTLLNKSRIKAKIDTMADLEPNFDLSQQDYSKKPPRRQTKIIGQKSALGEVDTTDLKDMLRLWLLDIGEGTDQIVGKISSDQELLSWAKNLDENWYMWPIRGSEGVTKDEVGEIQGWVQFYPEDEERLNKLISQGKIPEPDKKTRVFETSYIRLANAEKGQVSAGLRQALIALHEAVNERKKSTAYKHIKYLITSYVDPIK